jgi:hypothetical protein
MQGIYKVFFAVLAYVLSGCAEKGGSCPHAALLYLQPSCIDTEAVNAWNTASLHLYSPDELSLKLRSDSFIESALKELNFTGRWNREFVSSQLEMEVDDSTSIIKIKLCGGSRDSGMRLLHVLCDVFLQREKEQQLLSAASALKPFEDEQLRLNKRLDSLRKMMMGFDLDRSVDKGENSSHLFDDFLKAYEDELADFDQRIQNFQKLWAGVKLRSTDPELNVLASSLDPYLSHIVDQYSLLEKERLSHIDSTGKHSGPYKTAEVSAKLVRDSALFFIKCYIDAYKKSRSVITSEIMRLGGTVKLLPEDALKLSSLEELFSECQRSITDLMETKKKIELQFAVMPASFSICTISEKK